MQVRNGIENLWNVSVIFRKSYSSQNRLSRRKFLKSMMIDIKRVIFTCAW